MAQEVFALVDCNACYCSIETIFKPWLRDKAIIALSNNDGAVVARNRKAKQLGVKMAAPFFEIEHLHRSGELVVFSSNYALYQDISNRVMRIIEGMCPRLEVYSIDEGFALLSGMPGDLLAWGYRVKDELRRQVDMPVGVGIATSKTAAKLANWAAKKWVVSTGGVVDMRDPVRLEKLLRHAPVDEVWGIGRRLTARLESDLGITTAYQLANADLRALKRLYGVNVEKTARELMGESCYALEDGPEPKKMIASTRSFGSRVYQLEQLETAVATYVARAAAKLRSQGSLAQCIQVFANTSPFASGDQYRGSKIVGLPVATADTRDLIAAALGGLREIYRQGPAYAKAGVILSQFVQKKGYTPDMFAPATREKSEAVMLVLDSINAKAGAGTIRLAREAGCTGWSMKRQFMSPRYTTSWDELPVAH